MHTTLVLRTQSSLCPKKVIVGDLPNLKMPVSTNTSKLGWDSRIPFHTVNIPCVRIAFHTYNFKGVFPISILHRNYDNRIIATAYCNELSIRRPIN
mmetsp:Transcript_26847/g.37466  ORF Transcript_26847/g.37466 Transcript_26847/m.37466 type:complete len:96 (+) Transcript_26847:141-428(+)